MPWQILDRFEETLKMMKKPESANQLLHALLDRSSSCGDTPQTTSNTCCSTTSTTNSSVGQVTEEKTGFLTTRSLQDKEVASSGYSSILSFPSSSNQSLESLHQPPPLRKIYIDGSNVARTYGKVASFSWTGIKICVEWFHSRQHRVKVFVPDERCETADPSVLAYLNDLDALVKTPSGYNDDFFVIEAAKQNNGVIVSNDKFRYEKEEFDNDLRRFVDLNRLPYVFVDDQFMPARDPRGRSGPSLNDFLRDIPDTGYHSRPPRQRYQRSGPSKSHYTRVVKPRLVPTCSLPASFRKD